MSNTEVDTDAVIIENGTAMVRAGFGVDYAPKAVLPTIVGRLKQRDDVVSYHGQSGSHVGDRPQVKRSTVMELQHPIEHGIITNWDAMEEVWQDTYKQLQAAPEDHPVVLTEVPLNPKPNREKTTQIMFETFKIPSMFLAVDAVLSLYCCGRTTGLVLDCGESVSRAVLVYEVVISLMAKDYIRRW